ncbi:MAG TPA: HlyU family transcriptional regulator [Aestuariivirgaceae bacterium]|nr:HlyU family transcriptional regulator [Aestuariivirgaceae bacterium]
MSMLKSLWDSLMGKGGADAEAVAADPVEYKGYRIRPSPYQAGSQYQTSGTIEKNFPSGTKEHRFVRAESHPSKEDAVAFSLIKARQIIDQQGDRMFEVEVKDDASDGDGGNGD